MNDVALAVLVAGPATVIIDWLIGSTYPLNPLRLRTGRDSRGLWSARYVKRNRTWKVSGFEDRSQAIAELRRFVGMEVVQIDGRFVEVPRTPHWRQW